jgi:TM2 domain-containing membrane protein YozV
MLNRYRRNIGDGGIGMKESEDWSQNMNEIPLPPSPDAERVQQQERWAGYGPNGYPVSQQRKRKKSKWIAGLLAFLIPGIGHMYLGLMVKGIVLLSLLMFNILAIVFAVMEINNVLSILFFSLLIPIIYFYNLFDAVQSTDAVNERNDSMGSSGGFRGGWAGGGFVPPAPQTSSSTPQSPTEGRSGLPPIGVVLLAGAGVVFLLMSGTDWTHRLFNSAGSMFGAVVLIAAGVALWFWESRGHQRKGN